MAQAELLPFLRIVEHLKQLCAQGRSGTLFLVSDDNRMAQVRLDKGQIASLLCRNRRGLDALGIMRSMQNARVRFDDTFMAKGESDNLSNQAIFDDLFSGAAGTAAGAAPPPAPPPPPPPPPPPARGEHQPGAAHAPRQGHHRARDDPVHRADGRDHLRRPFRRGRQSASADPPACRRNQRTEPGRQVPHRYRARTRLARLSTRGPAPASSRRCGNERSDSPDRRTMGGIVAGVHVVRVSATFGPARCAACRAERPWPCRPDEESPS
jgi:hypothetical protein